MNNFEELKAEAAARNSANLNEHVALHNRLVEALNTYLPKVVSEFEKGFKVKENNCFYKKDQERFDSLLDELCKEFGFNDRSDASLKRTGSNYELVVRGSYFVFHDGENVQRPYSLSEFVWDANAQCAPETTLKEILSTEEVRKASHEAAEIEQQIAELQSKLYALNLQTKPFSSHLD
ncbi:hypothetical protein [Vibrio sp. D431a]|uniref:hypothetical protein n=1 Tax=Vibrio sp. D431a TaxID=2837388 RepID=UPI0025538581|nr:hypothetical protein [Vibrio sp. D431a]MDK9793349.1 hypothetical protein [Vibrio sp. D431a]